MAIKNTVSIDFDPRSLIVDNVFDCRLPGVITVSVPIYILKVAQQGGFLALAACELTALFFVSSQFVS